MCYVQAVVVDRRDTDHKALAFQVENYWAPVDVSWGYESRLGSIRLIGPPTSPDSATRLEVVRFFVLTSLPSGMQEHSCLTADCLQRVPGADM